MPCLLGEFNGGFSQLAINFLVTELLMTIISIIGQSLILFPFGAVDAIQFKRINNGNNDECNNENHRDDNCC